MEHWLTPTPALSYLTKCRYAVAALASPSPHYHLSVLWPRLCTFADYPLDKKCLLAPLPIEITFLPEDQFKTHPLLLTSLSDCPLFLGVFLSYYTVQYIQFSFVLYSL